MTPSSDGGSGSRATTMGPYVVAHAGAVRQEEYWSARCVYAWNETARDLVPAVEGGAVQRLDVLEDVLDLQVAGRDLPLARP